MRDIVMESSRRKGAVNSEAKIAVCGASSGRWAARFVDRPGAQLAHRSGIAGARLILW